MRRPSHATVVAYLALFFAMTGTAVAATGGTFLLGKSNNESSLATLSNTAGTPLALHASSGHAPLSVNRSTKVANLNADLLDGRHAMAFLPVTGEAANSNLLDGLDSSAFQRKLSSSYCSSQGAYVSGLTSNGLTCSRPFGGGTILASYYGGCPTGTYAWASITFSDSMSANDQYWLCNVYR